MRLSFRLKVFYLFCSASLLSTTCAFAQVNAANKINNNDVFQLGAGRYDITGPAAEEGMMGYGMIMQQTAGIYQRLWARAFVIESPTNHKRVVLVNVDLGHVFQGIKEGVVKKLQALYGDRYDDANVLITATHTHSGPGGYSTYVFYNLTTLGFSRENFNTIIDGIVAAISQAQAHMVPGRIKVASGELEGISFNRSPSAYELNPRHEIQHYAHDVDTQMTLLRFEDLQGAPIGMINWFPIHGVSMNNKNHLITGDNKGYAEYLFEQDYRQPDGHPTVIAAFAQANAGDVSPNRYGHEGGEGLAGLAAIAAAGQPQYEKARSLFNAANETLAGDVDYRHQFIKMDEVVVEPAYTDGKTQMTCPAGIGVSMFAGTQDGEGVGRQGVTCDSVKKVLPHVICELSRTTCQGVKPIALSTGTMTPHPWTPNILPFQVIKLGDVVIVAAPFELTTMTGRRIREAVRAQLPQQTTQHVVLAALSNAYAGYVATNEEYQLQRYEGASTHFGPWTQAALQQSFVNLTRALVAGRPVAPGPQPPDLSQSQRDLQPGVFFDTAPLQHSFGDVARDVQSNYHPGETVEVSFWGGHPKNNYRIGGSYLAVQQWVQGVWRTIRTDDDWDTAYHWQRKGIANNLITIVWRTPTTTPPGIYRIVHEGDYKSLLGRQIKPYRGESSLFTVS